MIRINLLPITERPPKWPINRIFIILGSLVCLICISLYSYNSYTIWKVERQIIDNANQYELLAPIQAKMVIANGKQQALATKTNLLVTLTAERKSWYAITIHLAAIIPPSIWLSELGTVDKNVIKISGVATSYPELAQFIKILEQDTVFADPVLVGAELTPNATMFLPKFEITIKLKG